MDVTYFMTCLWFLFSGIEYAVILPTLNQYLITLDASTVFIGITLSAFSLTGLLSAPFYGRFSDRTNSTKPVVMFSNMFEIGGNVLYFAATTPWMVVGARLIAGLGSGSVSCLFGAISKRSSKEERTSKFAQLMAVRQFGLLIGPACNLFLETFDFYIGAIHVTSLSAPGLFMAVVWTLYNILMAFGYKESNAQTEDDVYESIDNPSVQIHRDEISALDEQMKWSYIAKDLLREEVIVCFMMTFLSMFVQTGFEAMLTPLTYQYFGWQQFDNSMFFIGAGIVVIAGFIFLAMISKFVTDRQMIVIGFGSLTTLFVLFLVLVIFAASAPQGAPWVFGCFIAHSILLIFTLPFVFVPQVSLFSKITNVRTQSFNQGARTMVRGLGQILGPLWAASLTQNLPILVSVNTAVTAIALAMIIASYGKLIESDVGNNTTSSVVAATSENDPLLPVDEALA